MSEALDQCLIHKNVERMNQLLTQCLKTRLTEERIGYLGTNVVMMFEKAIEMPANYFKCFCLLLWFFTDEWSQNNIFLFQSDKAQKTFVTSVGNMLETWLTGHAIDFLHCHPNHPLQFVLFDHTDEDVLLPQFTRRLGYMVDQLISIYIAL